MAIRVFFYISFAAAIDLPQGVEGGFLNVGYGTRYFYYLAPAQSHRHSAPLVLWLAGGPACSSGMSLFIENGPYKVVDNATLVKNKFSWNKVANMLFVDQPVGAGYSYVYSQSEYQHFSIREKDIDAQLFTFLQEFINIYPEFRNRAFYITGESYAGHYVPSLAAHIVKFKNELDLELRGISLGNALVDSHIQFQYYIVYAKKHHLVTPEELQEMEAALPTCLALISDCKQTKEILLCGMAYGSCVLQQMNANGALSKAQLNMYDITKHIDPKVSPYPYANEMTAVAEYLNQPEVKRFLGVPEERPWVMCDMESYARVIMGRNFLTSYIDDVRMVLNDKTDVLVYAGANDFMCNWDGTEAWVNRLAGPTFAHADYEPLGTKGLAGKFKRKSARGSTLTLAEIYNAGHMAPQDQPAIMLALMDRLFNEHNGVDKEKDVYVNLREQYI